MSLPAGLRSAAEGAARVVGGPYAGDLWRIAASPGEEHRTPLGYYRYVPDPEPAWVWVNEDNP